MYNGVEYAERRTLISSHERATGSHFISGTVENVYSTSHLQEIRAKEETALVFFPQCSPPLFARCFVASPRSSAASKRA